MILQQNFYFRHLCWFPWWWVLICLGLGFLGNFSSYCFWKDCLFKRYIWGQFGFDAVPLTPYLKTVRTDQISALFNPVLSVCHWPPPAAAVTRAAVCAPICVRSLRDIPWSTCPHRLCLLATVGRTVLPSFLGPEEVFSRNTNQILLIQLP